MNIAGVRCRYVVCCVVALFVNSPTSSSGEDSLRSQTAAALRKATVFFRGNVAAEGGYLWRYSHDLARREGESRATAATAWVQPPGTPSVGLAYLQAYRLCGEKYLLEAARETAGALIRGQLRSGGWDYRIEFDPKQRKRYAYRVDPPREKARNTTTLDDDNTQSALRFLMELDLELKFKHEPLHEAVKFALNSLLKAQYSNGAWPQRYSEFPNPREFPVRRANYPKSWPREHPGKDYRGFYTFNDNAISDIITTLWLAGEIYQDKKYQAAAVKAGNFILLAQMPEPQPGWAQQYNADMQPAWARRFEPPSVTGGEARGILRTLLRLYRYTGKQRFLEPVPRALAYYRRSRLPDGRLARFYELKTNKPLYFTKGDYRLTYRDDNLPTHYGFQVSDWTAGLQREYKRAKSDPVGDAKIRRRPRAPKATAALTSQVKAVLASMDARGAWVEKGRLRAHGEDDPTRRVIETRTFINHIGLLAGYLAATAKTAESR